MNLTPQTKALYVAEMRRRQAGYDYLAQERVENVKIMDTPLAMRQLAGLADWASKHRPPEPTSGLIEFYRVLMKPQA